MTLELATQVYDRFGLGDPAYTDKDQVINQIVLIIQSIPKEITGPSEQQLRVIANRLLLPLTCLKQEMITYKFDLMIHQIVLMLKDQLNNG